MKKYMLWLCLAALVCSSAADGSESSDVRGHGNWYHIGRGFANIGTCFLEVPRCIFYYNGDVPVWGVVNGALMGSMRTGMRAFAGAVDVVTLGFDPGAMYRVDQLGDFVWDAPWIYRRKSCRWEAAVKAPAKAKNTSSATAENEAKGSK